MALEAEMGFDMVEFVSQLSGNSYQLKKRQRSEAEMSATMSHDNKMTKPASQRPINLILLTGIPKAIRSNISTHVRHDKSSSKRFYREACTNGRWRKANTVESIVAHKEVLEHKPNLIHMPEVIFSSGRKDKDGAVEEQAERVVYRGCDLNCLSDLLS